MSEVKRYTFKGAAGEYVYAVIYDALVADRESLKLELIACQARRRQFCEEVTDRLTTADQRIDDLESQLAAATPPAKSDGNPEGKRERFNKWVMATKHPVLGFLDGRSLARGDDREGYADEYVQGLWFAFKAFGAEQPTQIAVASRDESICWLKRIDGIGQNRAELICSMGFRRHTEVPQP